MSSFIKSFKLIDFNKRQREAHRVISKHPERCAIIVGKIDNTDITDIDKHKFLVPRELSISQFMHTLRTRIQLPPEKAMFLFVGKILPSGSQNMGFLYDKYRDDDGFLYISYASENTFGYPNPKQLGV